MIAGAIVAPEARPSSGSIENTPTFIAGEPFAPLDVESYRVNTPWFDTSLRFAGFTNIPMLYGLRTYGGLDSVVSKNLYDFITAFEKPNDAWYMYAGIMDVLTNTRMLDLFGVRYDARADDTVMIRPDALARFSAFEDYQVVPDRDAMLRRLKDPAFDPTTTVLLDRNPDWPPAKAGPRFQPLDFTAKNDNELSLDLNFKRPTIVLFDDSYHQDWQARWNGRAIPVMLANGNFMAVALPGERGTLSFEFRPQPFLLLFKISTVALLLVLMVGAYAAVTAGWRNLRSRPSTAKTV